MKNILLPFFLLITFQAISQSEKWETTTLKKITKGKGRLNLNFPEGADWSVDIYNGSKKFITNKSLKDLRNAYDTRNYYEMTPGIYHFKLNSVMIENVPIEEGKETRIKAGVLDLKNSGRWELRNETGQKFITSGNKRTTMALPLGKYQIKEVTGSRLIEIRDQLTMLEASIESPQAHPLWVSSTNSGITAGKSRVSVVFPQFEPVPLPLGGTANFPEIKCNVYVAQHFTSPVELKCNMTPKDIDTGSWYSAINGMPLGEVPYKAGKEIRLKVGFLAVSLKGEENEFAGLEDVTNLGTVPGSSYIGWTLRSLWSGKKVEFSKGGIYTFPPGEYSLWIEKETAGWLKYNATISEGKFAVLKKIE